MIFLILPLSLIFIYLYDRILPSNISKSQDLLDSIEDKKEKRKILFIRALIWTVCIVVPRMFYSMHFSLITSLISFLITLALYYCLDVRYFLKNKLKPKYKLLFSIGIMCLSSCTILASDIFLN